LALNRISDDLADDGKLQPGPFIKEFVTAIRSLSPETIAANLRSRSLVDYPQGLGVPDISVFLNLCAGNFECPWSGGAPMPLTLYEHATAVHAGKIYVFGGFVEVGPYATNAVNAYDPVTNEWTPKHRIPATDVRTDFNTTYTAHAIGDKIYVVVGAKAFAQLQNKLFAYDPVTDQWSPRAARPTYRDNFASVAANGLLYVIGGSGDIGNGPGTPTSGFRETKSHVEIYDPATDSWSTGAPLPMALAQARACAVGDQIYVFEGTTDAGLEGAILSYDTMSNSWSAKAPMRTARYPGGFNCVTVDGTVYLLGSGPFIHGFDPGTIDRYDPYVETWSSPIRMPTPREYLSAAVVGRRIFMMGGVSIPPNRHQPIDIVEILDTDRL
jgi:N-acetylneuraminic acid mutarotase